MDFSQSPAGQALRKALAGRDVREEELTLSNPDVADMAAMLERVGGEPYGLILAVGGGSVMDTAKTLALAIVGPKGCGPLSPQRRMKRCSLFPGSACRRRPARARK